MHFLMFSCCPQRLIFDTRWNLHNMIFKRFITFNLTQSNNLTQNNISIFPHFLCVRRSYLHISVDLIIRELVKFKVGRFYDTYLLLVYLMSNFAVCFSWGSNSLIRSNRPTRRVSIIITPRQDASAFLRLFNIEFFMEYTVRMV